MMVSAANFLDSYIVWHGTSESNKINFKLHCRQQQHTASKINIDRIEGRCCSMGKAEWMRNLVKFKSSPNKTFAALELWCCMLKHREMVIATANSQPPTISTIYFTSWLFHIGYTLFLLFFSIAFKIFPSIEMIDLKKMRSKGRIYTIYIQLYAIQLIFHSNQELDKTSSPRFQAHTALNALCAEGEVNPTLKMHCVFSHLSNRNNIIAKTLWEKLEFQAHTKKTEHNVEDNDKCVDRPLYQRIQMCELQASKLFWSIR